MHLFDRIHEDLPSAKPVSAVVGFDGFVDEIIHVIGRRSIAGVPEPVPSIEAFGSMIKAAAGRSFGREISIVKVEGGGNGPNFADGLLCLGANVDLYGTLGQPMHPAFADVAARCRTCTAIGGGFGRTLALEFADGKLMLNETSRLANLDEGEMIRVIEDGAYGAACARADIIGLCNWSKYPHMTACWRVVRDRVLARLTHRPWVLVDLADPAGRAEGDVRGVLDVIGGVQGRCRVVLGVNLHEAGVILRVLGMEPPGDSSASMQAAAESIRERVGVEVSVVHSQRRAAGAWRAPASSAEGSVCVEGAYTASPVRTTGVGDRFNAGLAYALACGGDAPAAVALGCATGGYFVRHGRAGSMAEVRAWAASLPAGAA